MRKAILYDNFYYLSGLLIAEILGQRSMVFRRRVVDDYKRFVDASGGTEAFANFEDAIRKFGRGTQIKEVSNSIRQFYAEHDQGEKRERRISR